MNWIGRSALGCLCALVLGGCGNLDVTPEGTLPTPLVIAAVTSDDSVVLACDRLGNLTVNGQALDLPRVREDSRLGLRLVDASWLPPVWRPAYARDGGYLVTRLHKASPLALRGLRPLDRVLTLNGEPLGEASALSQILRDSRRQRVSLGVRHPDGREEVLDAEPDERVGASTRIDFPFVFERRSSSQGQAFSAGPLGVICYWRSRRKVTYEAESTQSHSKYSEDFEWGALCNLVGYRRERDPRSGEERSELTLFWLFSFGDDL